jgi:hypothetical protein
MGRFALDSVRIIALGSICSSGRMESGSFHLVPEGQKILLAMRIRAAAAF